MELIINKKNKSSAGFTLVEMSIVIVIIGILMTGMMHFMVGNVQKSAFKTTRENIETVRKAIQAYYVINRHFPCPASIIDDSTSEMYGKAIEKCYDEKVSMIAPEAAKDKVVTAYNPNKRPVVIGLVPFRSLGIPDSEARDGWGNLIQYAVSGAMTEASLFSQMIGAIDVVAEDSQSRVVPPHSVQYVLLSSGQNGYGGYSENVVQTMPCPEETYETENCDEDTVFMDAPITMDKGEDYNNFDDILFYQQYDPDLDGAGGLLFKYKMSCMKDFSEVVFDSDDTVGLETLAKDLPTLYTDEKNDDYVLCYSSKYAVKMINTIEMDTKEPLCPTDWTFIGYKYFQGANSGGSMTTKRKGYVVCAR